MSLYELLRNRKGLPAEKALMVTKGFSRQGLGSVAISNLSPSKGGQPVYQNNIRSWKLAYYL